MTRVRKRKSNRNRSRNSRRRREGAGDTRRKSEYVYCAAEYLNQSELEVPVHVAASAGDELAAVPLDLVQFQRRAGPQRAHQREVGLVRGLHDAVAEDDHRVAEELGFVLDHRAVATSCPEDHVALLQVHEAREEDERVQRGLHGAGDGGPAGPDLTVRAPDEERGLRARGDVGVHEYRLQPDRGPGVGDKTVVIRGFLLLLDKELLDEQLGLLAHEEPGDGERRASDLDEAVLDDRGGPEPVAQHGELCALVCDVRANPNVLIRRTLETEAGEAAGGSPLDADGGEVEVHGLVKRHAQVAPERHEVADAEVALAAGLGDVEGPEDERVVALRVEHLQKVAFPGALVHDHLK